MTAVEWLINELHKKEEGLINTSYNHIFDAAKELEKQQIIDAYNFSQIPHLFKWDAKQYYETYKNTKE
jgi:hypothetical protein